MSVYDSYFEWDTEPRRNLTHLSTSTTTTYTNTRLNTPDTPSSLTTSVNVSSVIDPKFQSIFAFTHFNKVQSAIYQNVLESDSNVVISAPTGSGKTAIMELAIIHELSSSPPLRDPGKILYVAPVRALCSERARDWKSKFSNIGVVCMEFTGDTENISLADLQKCQIFVTTPEKWDSITRNVQNKLGILSQIHLLLIDEVHMLHETRGPTLEVIVSRMKAIHKDSHLRLIAISATVDNIEDIGEWLDSGSSSSTSSSLHSTHRGKCIVRQFGEEYRPVRLEKHVLGYADNGKSYYAFEKSLEGKLYDIYRQYGNSRPCLVFCGTRKSTCSAANALVGCCENILPGSQSHPFVTHKDQSIRLKNATSQLSDKNLISQVIHGVVFHNGGLSAQDRQIIEKLFLNSDIKVICTTSTLACGVNLPAHLVIVKSTKVFTEGKLADCSTMDILQMIGRAGRPQFDTSATAVIMCPFSEQARLKRILTCTEVIESKLHTSLIEHVNSEIGLGTVSDVSSAISWLKSTFLYVRMGKNPQKYRIGDSSNGTLDDLEKYAHETFRLLSENELVTNSQGKVYQTQTGSTMSKYYVKFTSMISLLNMGPLKSEEDLLYIISECSEYSEMRFETGEKSTLNQIVRDLRFKISGGKVSTVAHKVFVLLQCKLGRLTNPSLSHANIVRDMESALKTATRLCKCCISVALKLQDSQTLLSAVRLFSQLNAGLWDVENEEFSILKMYQIPGIGVSYGRKLIQAGFSTYRDLLESDPRKIEVACNKNPPFGNAVIAHVKNLPWLKMELTKFETVPPLPECEVSVEIANSGSYKKRGKIPEYLTFLAFTEDNIFMDFRRIQLGKIPADGKRFTLRVPNSVHNLKAYAICEDYIGVNISKDCVIGGVQKKAVVRKMSFSNFKYEPASSSLQKIINKEPKYVRSVGSKSALVTADDEPKVETFKNQQNEFNETSFSNFKFEPASSVLRKIIDKDPKNVQAAKYIGTQSSGSKIIHETIFDGVPTPQSLPPHQHNISQEFETDDTWFNDLPNDFFEKPPKKRKKQVKQLVDECASHGLSSDYKMDLPVSFSNYEKADILRIDHDNFEPYITPPDNWASENHVTVHETETPSQRREIKKFDIPVFTEDTENFIVNSNASNLVISDIDFMQALFS